MTEPKDAWPREGSAESNALRAVIIPAWLSSAQAMRSAAPAGIAEFRQPIVHAGRFGRKDPARDQGESKHLDVGTSAASRTASEGRQRRTPFGVTTIGRLMRIGCFSIRSMSSSSDHFGSSRPSAS